MKSSTTTNVDSWMELIILQSWSGPEIKVTLLHQQNVDQLWIILDETSNS